MHFVEYISLFTLGFSSLFPLINPLGTALIINPILSRSPFDERKAHALSIVLICFVMGIITLFGGSWFLRFMGISIPSTQMAGGIVLAQMGLSLLNAVPDAKDSGPVQAGESLFYPMAFPLTLGPGGIATLITLSAHSHSPELSDTFLKMGVIGLALASVLVITYFSFAYTNLLIAKIGKSGSQALNRLMAFVVFCIGIQMFVTGLAHSFPTLFH